MKLEERRKKRSCDPLIALHYQLAHTRSDADLEAIVVADTSGVVLAGAGAWALCEELAAYAPLLAYGAISGSAQELESGSRVAAMKQDVDVQSVEIDGQEVLLCARGGSQRGRFRADAMKRAAAGVSRILRTDRRAAAPLAALGPS